MFISKSQSTIDTPRGEILLKLGCGVSFRVARRLKDDNAVHKGYRLARLNTEVIHPIDRTH
jgi:hypothetical protein